MTDIFYMEDDRDIARLVRDYLEQRDCRVSVYVTVAEAEEALRRKTPELMLLDWNMPDGEGDAFCRRLRARLPELPVIYLTVRSDTADVVRGFQNGADDYVTKPFELEVLYSRICALRRRTARGAGRCLSCGPILLDESRMAVYCGEEEIRVGQTEYQLLSILMRNKGRTITRERLLEQIWDVSGNYVNDNTLTVTMKRLREKLGSPPCLKTVRSFGYRMEDTE